MKNIGEHVCFRLDGNWIGAGNITYIYTDTTSEGVKYDLQYEVKLTIPCKEFPVGTKVIIGVEEIV